MKEELLHIKKELSKKLKKERFEHTVGVMYTSASLAMRYGANIEKAMTAGLLHDCGKYFYAVRRANKEKNKKAIAFRADFDALPIEDEIDAPYKSIIPGVGHKCGHDGHAAALCGLALELEDMNLERDVYMVFQHAE